LADVDPSAVLSSKPVRNKAASPQPQKSVKDKKSPAKTAGKVVKATASQTRKSKPKRA